MTDSHTIAELSDNQKLVEKYLTKVRSNLDKVAKLDRSDQKRIRNQITSDLRSVNAIIDTMKLDVRSLKSEEMEAEFKEIISNFRADYKKLSDEAKSEGKPTTADSSTLGRPTGQESSQEMMDKGDAILDESGKAIERMQKKTKETKDVSTNIKENLSKQMGQLDKVNRDLTEMDYSLNRATKTLTTMMRTYATDKLIMVIILIILVIIVAIICFSMFGDGETKNQPDDIFSPRIRVITDSGRRFLS